MIPALLLELLLRLAGPVLPGDYQTAVFLEPSADFGRINRPNSAGWNKDLEFATWVRINSKGLRGPEIDYAKPPDTFRILVLGDSFTLGLQVGEAQTFVSRLAERLNHGGLSPRAETINAGTSGWSTVNEYAWLTKEGYRYTPDLVLLMFYVGNDPYDNANQSRAARANAEELSLSTQAGQLHAARGTLRDASAAYTAFETGVLLKLAYPSAKPSPDGLPARPVRNRDEDLKQAWEVSEKQLARLRDYSTDSGIKLVVVGIPTASQVYAARRRDQPLQQIAHFLGVEYVDLLEPFRARARASGQLLYFNHNGHWNMDGNDLAAEVVTAKLLARGVLPDPRS
jgi:hypothetical protein